jgi:glucose-1-phosphate thymidylyltransferase
MDCGNPQITVATNTEMLQILEKEEVPLIAADAQLENTQLIEPCYIGPGAKITNSTLGPHVSIGAGTQVTNCQLEDCLIQNNSTLVNAQLKGAMIGNQVYYNGEFTTVNLGDYSTLS